MSPYLFCCNEPDNAETICTLNWNVGNTKHIYKMFSNSGHISDIFTKPLAEDLKTIEEEDTEKDEEIAPKTKKKPPKKPKRELLPKTAITTPGKDIAYQTIERDVKMKIKRETPGKKGLVSNEKKMYFYYLIS